MKSFDCTSTGNRKIALAEFFEHLVVIAQDFHEDSRFDVLLEIRLVLVNL